MPKDPTKTRYGHDKVPTRIWSFHAMEPTLKLPHALDQMALAKMHQNNLIRLEINRKEQYRALRAKHFPDFPVFEERLRKINRQLATVEESAKDRAAKASAPAGKGQNATPTRAKYMPEESKLRRELLAEKKQISGPFSILKQEIRELQASFREATADTKEMELLRNIMEAKRAEADRLAKIGDRKRASVIKREIKATKRALLGKRSVLVNRACRTHRFAGRAHKIDARAQKEARRLRATCGCYWGTYQPAEDAAKAANKSHNPRMVPIRREGGKVGVQLQKGLSCPAAFLATADKGDKQVRILPHPWGDGWQEVHLRIGTQVNTEARHTSGSGEPLWCVLPVKFHRPLPEGVRIQRAYLVRRRVATKWKWRFLLYLANPAGWQKPDCAKTGSIGVNLNWRQFTDDSLRVATAIGSDGQTHDLFLPERLRARFAHEARLENVRTLLFNETRDRVAKWLSSHRSILPAWLQQRMETHRVGEWRSEARLAGLAIQWRHNRFPGDEEIFEGRDFACARDLLRKGVDGSRRKAPPWLRAWRDHADSEHSRGRLRYILGRLRKEGRTCIFLGRATINEEFDGLESWRQADKHLYEYQVGNLQGAQRAREDLYRNFAASLRREYRTIVLGKVDYAKLARLPQVHEKGQADKVRFNARVASPGRLHVLLKENAANSALVNPAGITQRCHACGTMQDFDAAVNILHTCTDCGETWDQDVNAAANLLALYERKGG